MQNRLRGACWDAVEAALAVDVLPFHKCSTLATIELVSELAYDNAIDRVFITLSKL